MEKRYLVSYLLIALTLLFSLLTWSCIGDPSDIIYPDELSTKLDDASGDSDIDDAPEPDADIPSPPFAEDGEGCAEHEDCKSLFCVDQLCRPASCFDEAENEDETDIDCGGSDCPPCANKSRCQHDIDCQSGLCDDGICRKLSCGDGHQNSSETGIDCGGPDCAPCEAEQGCHEPTDCLSGVCTDEICKAPACNDGVQNGTETDIDCGGPDCQQKCELGQRCDIDSDCAIQSCLQGLCRLCDPVATPFGAGDGSKQDPYRICSSTQFNAIRTHLDSHFRLEATIDLNSSSNFEPIGSPTTPFSGSLDGNRFEIENLKVNNPEKNYQALFGYISAEARLLNLKLTNVTIHGRDYVGGLVGRNERGEIHNSFVTGQINGTGFVGGLVGENAGDRDLNAPGGIIQSSYATGSVRGSKRTGGLVGRNFRSEIYNSYAISEVTGQEYVGGLVGENSEIRTKLHDSYAISEVTGQEYVGGLVGRNFGPVETIESFWSEDACPSCNNTVGQALSAEQFKLEKTFEKWNLDEIWRMSTERPVLRWE